MKIIKNYFITILVLFILILSFLVLTNYNKSKFINNEEINTNYSSNTENEDYKNYSNNANFNSADLLKSKKLNTGIALEKDLLEQDLATTDKLSILNNNKYNLEDRILFYLGNHKDNTGLIYYDLNSNECIMLNENNIFVAASTYKVSLNVLTYEKAKTNSSLINTVLDYEDKYYEEGTGVLQDLNNIPSMKIQELLDLSIINSDNIATNMVGTYLGGHNNVRKEIFNMFNIDLPYSENITTPQAELKILKHIYDNKDDVNYSHLIKVLQSTDCHTRIDKYIPQEIVAHKIGSSNEYIHDIALVSSENPYILIIYTKGLDDPEEKIAQISKTIYNYHTTSIANN